MPVFAVGSANPAKVEPARRLLHRLFPGCRVVAVAVPSGVRPQPLSLEETREGAVTRGRGALERVQAARWGIGVEGGVDFDGSGCPWLVTVAAVVDRRGRVSTGEGLRLLLPSAFTGPLRGGQELAELVDQAFGVRGARADPGAVGYLTRGAVTRRQLVLSALAAALAPRLHSSLYPEFTESNTWPGAPSALEGARSRQGAPAAQALPEGAE